MMHGKQISDNEIYLLIKYIKSVLWRVAKRLSLYRGSALPKGLVRVRSGFYKHLSAGHSETGSMYCIIKCSVQGKQARVKNADLSHLSCTVAM